MANYKSLKTTINANVKRNGNQEITGQILNSVLNAMVDTLGTGYSFAGVATPATNPGTPDAKVFYIANGKGSYTHFGELEVTEDDVVVLYWDTLWHKVSTGISREEKLTNLGKEIATKQNALTDTDGSYGQRVANLEVGKQDALQLTVKDNGNIVLSNIQGQSKEFMPATPSGDPMHYAYETAGAEWNGTGADIIKTTPWADLADDDADKTVIHKAGYWYLNGLGDITNEQIRNIYNTTINFGISPSMGEALKMASVRTNFFLYFRQGTSATEMYQTFYDANIEVGKICLRYNITSTIYNIRFFATSNHKTRHFIGICDLQKISSANNVQYAFDDCTLLKTINIKILKVSLEFPNSSMLTTKSILYMINNEKETSAITITLHADAYTRAMANADIVAALEAHPNVSLASA